MIQKVSFKYRFSFLLLVIAFIIMPLALTAQEVKVSASLDTNRILIGKQARLTLKATTTKGVELVFPEVKDTITGDIELVSAGKIDTIAQANEITYKRDLIITAFDSGYFAIPPFKFKVKNDSTKSFETEALLFGVQTIAVDTTLAIKGIKAPIEPPWSIFEYQNEILAAIALILILTLVVYLIKRKKKVEAVPETPVILKPAHEIALEALYVLKNQKLWQQGRVKEYHIVISDTIRAYIEQRYAVGAMEMTSDEILKSVRLLISDQHIKSKLSNILILSDMVKFAKEQPLPNENEMSWDHAVEFVKLTAVINSSEELPS